MLKLYLLGPPRVELNGVTLQIRRRKAVALLIYLAVNNQPHSRDSLVTLFWPDLDQQRGRAYFRRDLAELNASLPDNLINAERELVELNPDASLWLDINHFRRLIAESRQHAHPSDVICTDCLLRLSEAAALYSNDFLAGFTLADSADFDDWQFFQSESLRQELALVLERLVGGLSAQGKTEAAIPHARRWVALDPLHEPAQRCLIGLYDQAGQAAAGLRQYEEYVRLLDEELGLPPEAETTTIYEAIKAKRVFAPFLKAQEQRSKKAVGRQQTEKQKLLGRAKEEVPAIETPPASGIVPTLSGEDLTPSLSSSASPPAMAQQIRLHMSPDGVQIAYATLGKGPLLVKAGNPLTHLMYDQQSPVWRHWWEGLARYHTLVRYDERGCGLSDWNVLDFSMDAWVQDLETVVNQFGSERFALLGVSHGVSVAIAYVVRHPERVSHLILYGGYARGRFHRNPSPEYREEAQTLINLIRFGWGKDHAAFRQVFTTLLIPEGTPEQINWFNDLARITASPENAATMEAAFYDINVLDLVPQVTTPTLILHARDDAMCPFSEGQLIAAHIPGAHFVPLASKNHILLEHEPAWQQFLAEVYQFLDVASEGPASPPKRQVFSSSTSTAIAVPPAPLFVARHQELAQLNALLETALSGESQVIFVTGEAGQGKSALLQAFAQRAQAAYPDLIVAGGTCNAYTGTGDPYLPFREILGLLTGAVEDQAVVAGLSGEQIERLRPLWPQNVRILLDEGADLLDTFVPAKALLNRATAFASGEAAWLDELGARVNPKLSWPNGAAVQQAALFAQYTRVIQGLSRQTPLLLLLDDLQWADTGSTNLLFHLGRRLAGHRVLLAGAYRPADVAVGRDGERHPLEFVVNEFQRYFGDIGLNLAQTEGETFVNALLDSAPNQLSDSFRAALFQQTGGHPLFTIELLRGMEERGDLIKDETGRWVEQPQLDWTALPPRVEGAIGARISRLEPALQTLLQIASIEGEMFTAEVVAQMLQVDARTVIDQLSRVLDRIHFLVRAEGIQYDGDLRLSRYRFRHILIQRYLYQNLDEIERVYHHEAIGRVLEMLYGPRKGTIIIQLAHHASAANLPERARFYLEQAGDRARQSAALAEAGRYYQSALALWPETEQVERARLLGKLGECQWVLGRLQDALTNLEAGCTLNQVLNNQKEAGVTQLLIGRLYWEQGNREESLRYHHQALATLEKLPESVELAQAFSAISEMYMLAAEYDQAIPWGERALELANRLGAEAVTARTKGVLGDVYSYIGEQERGLSLLRDSLQLALSLGLAHEACRSYLLMGEALASDCRYSEAQATFNQLESYAARMGASLFAGSAMVEITEILWSTGNWRAALSNYQPILAWEKQGQSLSYLQVIAANLFGQIYNDLGQPDRAWQILQETLPQVKGQNELQTLGAHLAESARALDGLGRKSEAGEQLRQLLALIKRNQYDHVTSIIPLLFSCGWFAAQASHSDEMLDDAKTSLHLLECLFRQTKSAVAESALNEARGIMALTEGHPEEAIGYFRKTSDGWQQLGRPYDQARALDKLGWALHQTKETTQAEATFQQARDIRETLAAQLENGDLKASFLNSYIDDWASKSP